MRGKEFLCMVLCAVLMSAMLPAAMIERFIKACPAVSCLEVQYKKN
jgi:hypothetical protein